MVSVPPKSACVFCPATQPEELQEHAKSYLRYIVIMEARAKPRLDGHISQEQHDATYQAAMAEWHRNPTTKPPRKGKQSTGVLGLWRTGTKGTRGGKKRPGMMTDYIREHGLLPAAEIDRLIAEAPLEIIDNQQQFANGNDIPDWHDFLAQFSPEDAVNEGQRISLPVVQH